MIEAYLIQTSPPQSNFRRGHRRTSQHLSLTLTLTLILTLTLLTSLTPLQPLAGILHTSRAQGPKWPGSEMSGNKVTARSPATLSSRWRC